MTAAELEEAERTLLPCPFCGGPARFKYRQAESLWSHNVVPWYSAACWDCDIVMNVCESLDTLFARWNARRPGGTP